MKLLTKLILITFQLSFSAFGAEEPTTPQADKPALSITAFTVKSLDGKIEMKKAGSSRTGITL